MEGIELVAFQIISAVGTARSYYIEAIQDAKTGDFEAAQAKLEAGSQIFLTGHHAHAELLQKEANNELGNITLLLMHAEDQLMSAEAFKIIAEELIDVYRSRK